MALTHSFCHRSILNRSRKAPRIQLLLPQSKSNNYNSIHRNSGLISSSQLVSTPNKEGSLNLVISNEARMMFNSNKSARTISCCLLIHTPPCMLSRSNSYSNSSSSRRHSRLRNYLLGRLTALAITIQVAAATTVTASNSISIRLFCSSRQQ